MRKYLKDWIRWLIDTYQFDGVRIDTLGHVPREFWREFSDAIHDVFCIGEAWKREPELIAPYDGYVSSLMNFPLYYAIEDVWSLKKSMLEIPKLFELERSLIKDITVLGVFADNHDVARFLHGQPDVVMFKAALVFTFTVQGIPIFYYGSEQALAGGNDP